MTSLERWESPTGVLVRARNAANKAELEVFRGQLNAQKRSLINQAKRQALGDAVRVALEEEAMTLNYGLHLADGDPAIIELTARKVALQEAIDNSDLARDFR